MFFYPTISNCFSQRSQVEVIKKYNMAVSNLTEEQIEEEIEKAKVYNNNLSGEALQSPFVEGSGYGILDNYTEILDISEDGVMGYIEIPKINVNLPIYHGTDEETMAKGVGHMEVSSFPIGGTSTHSALGSHTGYPSSELFNNLDKMEVGDIFYIKILNKVLTYKVYEIKVVLPDAISELEIEKGKDLVTLITCTPYGEDTHRLLVKSERTEYEEYID